MFVAGMLALTAPAQAQTVASGGAFAGVVGSGLWIIAAIVAVVCALVFRSTVSR